MRNDRPERNLVARLGLLSGTAIMALSLLTAMPANAQDGCDVSVRINTSGKRPVSVKPDEARLKTGQTVCWKVVGKPSETFLISYKNRSPTTSSGKSDRGWVRQTITASATGDPEQDTYYYNVTIPGGGTLDPTIIVDR